MSNSICLRCRGTRECVMLFALLGIWGCGEGRPSRVPVSGTVLIDGKPLTHGLVRFIPSGARASQGRLDESGRFTLSCFGDNDGAVLGEHVVVVDGSQYIKEDTRRWHAPRKYADQSQSGLIQLVAEPTESMTIELSWNGGRPFDEVDEGIREERKLRGKAN